jgi:GntR family transcriptional regulator, transcriptional repressor for pyruvate dehydrogenase complex
VTATEPDRASSGRADVASTMLDAALRPIQTLNRDTVVAEVVKQLLDHLASRDLAPGARLPSERQLSVALGLGRSTVREAIRTLNLLGIVDVRQGSGTYLRDADSNVVPQAIEWGLVLGERRTLDLVEARGVLEEAIAGLAAARVRDEDRQLLDERLADLRNAVESEDVESYIECDIAFHMELARIAGNSVMYDLLWSIRGLLRVWIRRILDVEGVAPKNYTYHHDVGEAVKAADPAAAIAAMSAHTHTSSQRLGSTLGAERED